MRKNKFYQKIIIPVVLFIFYGYLVFQILKKPNIENIFIDQKREDFNTFLDEHPYNNRDIVYEDYKKIPKKDRPDLAAEQNFFMMVDPNTLTVPYQEMASASVYTNKMLAQQKKTFKKKIQGTNTNQNTPKVQELSRAITVGANSVIWEERGPDNVGGRTRAILWDPNDVTNRRVFAAGVSGGIWVNDNVLDPNSSWRAIDDFLSSIAVNALVADPNNPQVFYAGTGEGWLNADAVRGIGVFKSTDAGNTWSLLSSTSGNEFAYIQKIAITPSGTILTATRGVDNTSGGIFRSTDNGDSFTRVLNTRGADIEIASNGDIYASRGIFSTGTLFKSIDDGVTWLDITPPNGNNPGRIEIALAPSNSNIIYSISQNRADNTIDWLQKSTDAGATWTNLTIPQHNDACAIEATDITRNLAWYALTMAVSPTNPDVVIVGGIDLARTDDGGQTWRQISEWLDCSAIENVHADQHTVVFRPNNPNAAIFGNDGGIYYSPNAGIATTPTFETRDKNYTTSQFYAVATDNITNSDYYIGGTQDNGSIQLQSNLNLSGVEVFGGDGAFAHIDQQDRTYQLVASQNGNVAFSSDGGASFRSLQTINSGNNFINQSDYDNNAGILYSTARPNSISLITGLKTLRPSAETVVNIDLGGRQTSAIRANTNTPNRLFVGTEGGRIYRIDNAHLASRTAVEITNNIAAVGNVSSIDVGANDMELIATYSNFGIPSVWYTSDGGNSWINKDATTHQLPNIPIRWALFNPNNTEQVLLATELGVWSTNNITAENPAWEPSNEGLANVRCDMIQYRAADGLVVVATHGRGFFTSTIFAMDDEDAPTIVSLNPKDDETTATPLNANLEIEFNEPIQVGTGKINIFLGADNSLIETINVTSSQVNTSGSRAIINPIINFNTSTSYYIQVDTGAFTDNFNNDFTGILDNTTWNFTTFNGDEPPVVNIPISDLFVAENSDDITIDLTTVFDDVDNDNNAITYTLISNTATTLIDANIVDNNLIVSLLPNRIGTAQISVSATSNGQTVQDTFNITVNSTAATIFNQTLTNFTSGRTEGSYNVGSIRNTDDFTVPDDEIWDLSTVNVQAFVLGEANLDLQNVNISIYNNNNGAPGEIIENQTILANQGQIIGGTNRNPSLTVRLNNNINLQPGTYWVSIHPTFMTNLGRTNITATYSCATSTRTGNSYSSSNASAFILRNADLLFSLDGENIVDDAPEVANPIANIELLEIPNPNPMILDLSSTFTDIDNDDKLITLEVLENTNSSLVTTTISNQELTLAYSGISGFATITIRATSNGLTVDDTFTVLFTPTLYAQTGNASRNTFSQFFQDLGGALESADNFTIPNGEIWNIAGVSAEGRAAGNDPETAFFIVYEDNNGFPGNVLFNSRDLATQPSNDSGSVFNFTLTTDTPITLSSGNYWISVQANQPFNPGRNTWSWSYFTPAVSGTYARQDVSGIIGSWANSWETTDDNGALIFSILGQRQQVLNTTQFNDEQLKLLRNPSTGIFEVALSTLTNTNLKVEVYDVSGRLIKKQSVSNNQSSFTIDIQNSASGIYIMRIIGNGKTKTFKLIKE